MNITGLFFTEGAAMKRLRELSGCLLIMSVFSACYAFAPPPPVRIIGVFGVPPPVDADNKGFGDVPASPVLFSAVPASADTIKSDDITSGDGTVELYGGADFSAASKITGPAPIPGVYLPQGSGAYNAPVSAHVTGYYVKVHLTGGGAYYAKIRVRRTLSGQTDTSNTSIKKFAAESVWVNGQYVSYNDAPGTKANPITVVKGNIGDRSGKKLQDEIQGPDNSTVTFYTDASYGTEKAKTETITTNGDNPTNTVFVKIRARDNTTEHYYIARFRHSSLNGSWNFPRP
jgi:hypothetical protein